MRIVRQITVAFCCLHLGACALFDVKQNAILKKYATIIEGQQSIIQSHASNLEQMSGSQKQATDQIRDMQDQLEVISSELKKIRASGDQANEISNIAAAVSPINIKRGKTSVPELEGKAVIGRVEYVWLDQAKVYLKARVDTGAKTSSLHAKNIQAFERNGEPWVRFNLADDEMLIPFEAPRLRYVRIRQASVEGLDRRPVINLKIRLGELHEESEFTLTDRKDMIYPVLLGRSFLKDIALVDVAKKFTRKRKAELKKQAVK